MTRKLRLLSAGLTVALTIGGCGDSKVRVVHVAYAPNTGEAECSTTGNRAGGLGVFPIASIVNRKAIDSRTPAAKALMRFLKTPPVKQFPLGAVRWTVIIERKNRVVFGGEEDSPVVDSLVTTVYGPNHRWTVTSSGECGFTRFFPGETSAAIIQPKQDMPESKTLHLRIVSGKCHDHDIPIVRVAETARRVWLVGTFRSRRRCAGVDGRGVPVAVKLASPVGRRKLVDGETIPGSPVQESMLFFH